MGSSHVSEELVMAFDSTQQALRAEMLMEYVGLDIDTCPTPKEITAGCALSIQFHPDDLEQVKSLIATEHIEIKGIFHKQGAEYIIISIT
ncbi:DUF3343 domain-containing protein [Paenibacillus apiarius]|uniref:DUF3343 domain-containing protein n=1 Tax=Paenibacillus apiarius TaxID=46240 RepID=A0ABT4DZ01_9BACL|nr:DUF3343 domain-containing protein [Paenibacillus apiarius]MCY9514084.1 DUF3343 domain-containing protein [Paenibacillus apiarius]MCY9522576.1 DUF3343 domain-containing protein [Paenibacillus apiarius]MCY9553002.1 DUF3343 domain-containing protein [Paenibacillus apiarius]MCY9556357.1 DUF3343 domain-containing protein [Paenibacillus apiarius]MCY9686457.1 DUF3343 domain-containing protein [Paenibacillus apiarius]